MSTSIYGQTDFYIKKTESSRLKKLRHDRYFDIKTVDTLYRDKRIVAFTDSSLSITKYVKTSDSIARIIRYPNPNANDTVYMHVWRTDTFSVAFKNIIYLKKDWFNDRRWLEPFWFMGVGAAMGVVLVPIAAIAYGPEDVKEAAVGIGTTLGVCATLVFIGTRKMKFDMKNKWEFTGTSTKKKIDA